MADEHRVVYGPSLLTEGDEYLFKEGTHFQLYDKLGAHPMTVDGESGTLFAVWAPNAESVSVIGDFNGWGWGAHPLAPRFDGSGIWEGFVTGVGRGALYKYAIRSRFGGQGNVEIFRTNGSAVMKRSTPDCRIVDLIASWAAV